LTNKASTKGGGNPTLYDRSAVERRRAPCGLVTDPSPRAIDPLQSVAPSTRSRSGSSPES
jgi:hypothetical protein